LSLHLNRRNTMTAKEVRFSTAAREKLLRGVDVVAPMA
jgi:hypothetical protein